MKIIEKEFNIEWYCSDIFFKIRLIHLNIVVVSDEKQATNQSILIRTFHICLQNGNDFFYFFIYTYEKQWPA